jgi:hypothetical protein
MHTYFFASTLQLHLFVIHNCNSRAQKQFKSNFTYTHQEFRVPVYNLNFETNDIEGRENSSKSRQGGNCPEAG